MLGMTQAAVGRGRLSQTADKGRLVVLGMHRSGTSVCTAALQAMGAYVGREEQLTGRSAENPLGFFERRDVRKVCDALLMGASADWWKVAAFDPSSIPDAVLSEQLGILRSILAELDRNGIWAIKEPRLSLLVPALRDVLGDAVFVHIFRDPVEVAKSLRHRNGFPMRAGLALWEAYNVAILRNTRGHPRLAVNYEQLVGSPETALRQLWSEVTGLGISLDDADTGVVAPELHREHSSAAERQQLLTDAQRRLWNHLSGGGGDGDFAVSEDALRVLREFEEDQTELLRLKKRIGELDAIAKRSKSPGGETKDIATAATGLLRFEGAVKALVEEGIARRDAKIAELQTSLAESAEQNESLAEANEALEQKIVATSAVVDPSRQAAIAAKVELAARIVSRRDARWRRLLDKRDDLITRLVERLNKANTDFDRLARAAKKATDVGSLARLRARLGAVRRSSESNAPNVHEVVAKAEARRATSREKEQKTIIPDAAHDVDRLPATVGISTRQLGRVVFVTAIAGSYDPVLDPGVVDLAADYVLFTDDPSAKSEVWKTRSFDYVDGEPARTARFVKTHPHLYFSDYDRVIWVDANLRIDCLAEDLISAHEEDADIITWRHPLRDCVYVEAEECILREKDDEFTIREHVKQLKSMGYPEHNGLIESSVMAISMRRQDMSGLFSDWWRLIDNGSRRDQMSFNPALSLHPGVRVGFFGEKGVEMRTDPRFTYRHHPSYRPLAPGLKSAEAG